MSRAFRGFVSDMDGVVADTEELWFEGTKEFLKGFGISMSLGEYSAFIGKPEADDARVFREKFGVPLSIEGIIARRRPFILKAMDRKIEVKDGYSDLLELLKKSGVKISIVSASPKVIMDKVLEVTGVGGYYAAAVSAVDAGTKTAAYKSAARLMGLEPSACFALEDSPAGVREAKEAGLYCVAVPNPLVRGANFGVADEVHSTLRGFLRYGKALRELAR